MLTIDPEKSIASLPIFLNKALLIIPLLKSKSIESAKFSKNSIFSIINLELIILIASSELI